MVEADTLLEFIEELFYQSKGEHFSDLQRTILLSSLQGNRTTYDQLAEDCGYSAKYVKQDIAPKLWQRLSDVLDQKVTKANVRATLEREFRHQPALSVSSVSNHLASPNLSFPASRISSTLSAPLASSSQSLPLTSPPLTPSSEKGNILLVDDQPKNLRLLSDVLEEEGYTVRQAINGNIALQAVTISTPDLILLDIHMPELDGYAVCQQLKGNPETQDIPVIFVSAMDEAWDKVKAFSVGGSDYITKPFKLVEVLARVENQLRVQTLQKTLKTQNAQLQQAIQELQRLAVIDPVTQIANRQRFNDYLQGVWKNGVETSASLSLILCAVGNMTALSDTHGSQAAEQCLLHVAQMLQRITQQPDDLVCRYGGATFGIILPNLEEEKATAIAHQLLNEFQSSNLASESPVVSSISTEANKPAISSRFLSVGITAMVPNSNTSIEQFIDRCDQALRKAKNHNDNSAVVN